MIEVEKIFAIEGQESHLALEMIIFWRFPESFVQPFNTHLKSGNIV